MIHPKTELRHINHHVGFGVFATELIPEGTIVYMKDSLEIVVSPDDYQQHPPQMQAIIEKYSYIDQYGNRIVSWDIAKYVNHSCNPNTISTGYGFEIALRDIGAGEQITDEYGIFNLQWEMDCECGDLHCRGHISPRDFHENYPVWDKKIKRSLPKLYQVEQPLLPFIDKEAKLELDLYFADPENYKSVFSQHYEGALV